MNEIDALKGELREIVKKAPELPPEIKKNAVYVEDKGQKIYLNAYIPFIGEKYGRATKILFYCTAQALSKRNAKYLKEYVDDPDKAIDRLRLRKAGTLDIDIGPVGGGVLPALAGLLLHAKDNLWIEDIADALQYISVTNFYKYSLWNSKKNDLNPDNLEDETKEPYDNFMFNNFIKQEISVLKPDYIFVCGQRGKHRFDLINQWLNQQKLSIKLRLINDPASLLHGSKVDSATLKDEKVEKLIGVYCTYIKNRTDARDPHFYTQYGGRTDQIKNYLRFCYQAKM